MIVRRWGIIIIATGWLAGLLAGSVLHTWLTLPALTIAGFVTVACAAMLTTVAVWRYRQTLMPLAAGWQSLLILIWWLAALTLGMARLAWAAPRNDPRDIANLPIGTAVTVSGTIDAAPDIHAQGAYLQVRITAVQTATGTFRADGVVECFDSQIQVPFAPEYGDQVEVKGTLAAVPPLAPPGLSALLRSAKLTIMQRGSGNPLLGLIYRWRAALAEGLQRALPAPEAALLIGILLGLKTPVLRSRLPLFTRTGTIHLVVTSGLKVTLIGGLAAAFARTLTRRLPSSTATGWSGAAALRVSIPLGAIVLYAALSGLGPAASRAAIMSGLLVFARAFGRDYDAFVALAVAALLMTLAQPAVLWDVGFQLSAVGTLALITLTTPLRARIVALERLPGGALLADALATTLAAQIGTFPLTAINFGLFSLIAPLANMILVPLLPLFLLLGGVAATVSALAPVAAGAAGAIIWPVARLADLVIEFLAAPSWAALSIGGLPGWLVPVWAILLGGAPMLWGAATVPPPDHERSHRLPAILSAAIALCLVLALFSATALAYVATPTPTVRVTFLNVGPSGPATVIQTSDGHVALVDGGADGTALLLALAQVLPFWQRTIDLVIVSDPRPGHLDGLPAVLTAFHVRQVVDGGNLHPARDYAAWYASLQAAHVPLTRLWQGATIALGQVRFVILAPGHPLFSGTGAEDDNALVFRMEAPGLRVLFAGEASTRALALAMEDPAAAEVVQYCAPPTPTRQQAQEDLQTLTLAQLAIAMPASQHPAAGVILTPPNPALVSLPPTLATETDGTIAIAANSTGWWIVGGG